MTVRGCLILGMAGTARVKALGALKKWKMTELDFHL